MTTHQREQTNKQTNMKSLQFYKDYLLLLVAWNQIMVSKLLIIGGNISNRIIPSKQMIIIKL